MEWTNKFLNEKRTWNFVQIKICSLCPWLFFLAFLLPYFFNGIFTDSATFFLSNTTPRKWNKQQYIFFSKVINIWDVAAISFSSRSLFHAPVWRKIDAFALLWHKKEMCNILFCICFLRIFAIVFIRLFFKIISLAI